MPLKDVDWREHDKAIASSVRQLTDQYLVGENTATPRNFRAVLEWLSDLTKKLPAPIQTAHLPPQIQKDIGQWKIRLRDYGRAQREAESVDADKHNAADYSRRVVQPLLLGWYPEAERQRAPDVITPISLAFQTKVAEQNMRDSWNKFVNDLEEGGKKVGGSILGTALAMAMAYGGFRYLTSRGGD